MTRTTVALSTLLLALAGGIAAATSARAQAPAPSASRPSFTVASVRVNTSGERRVGAGGPPANGRYAATNITLDLLIGLAFQPIHRLEIEGVPDWAMQARFDIEARADGNPPPAQMWLMLQTLLEERFKLVTHREIRQRPVYAMVLARPGQFGPQLRSHTNDNGCVDPAAARPAAGPPDPNAPLPPPPCGAWSGGPALGRMAGQRVTLETLGRSLSGQLGRLVQDRTGLTGTYDLTLEWDPVQMIPGVDPALTPNASTGSGRPSIFTAFQEQLGVRLVPQMGPVNVLVIDSVQMPSEN